MATGSSSTGTTEEDEKVTVCDTWKAAAFCARQSFGSCKELQFTQFCRNEVRRNGIRGCYDLDCSYGGRRAGPFEICSGLLGSFWGVLVSVGAFLGGFWISIS